MVALVPCNPPSPEGQPCTDESWSNQRQETSSAETVIPCHGLLGLTDRIQRLVYRIDVVEGRSIRSGEHGNLLFPTSDFQLRSTARSCWLGAGLQFLAGKTD